MTTGSKIFWSPPLSVDTEITPPKIRDGQEISTEKPVTFTGEVSAYAPIARVEIIGCRPTGTLTGGTLDKQVEPQARALELPAWSTLAKWEPTSKHLHFEWTETEPPAGETVRYLWVILEDNEMAWASPIWVSYAGEDEAETTP